MRTRKYIKGIGHLTDTEATNVVTVGSISQTELLTYSHLLGSTGREVLSQGIAHQNCAV